MSPIYEWFNQNLELVFLVYGLSFAVMGVAIWVQPRKDSSHPIARVMWLYVAYALVHAPADFLDMRAVIHGRDETLHRIGQILTYVSYAFLFEFGRRLLALAGRTVPAWILPVAYASVFAASAASALPWTTSNVLVGYFVRLPGGVMAGLGFYRYYRAHRASLDPLGSRKYFLAAAGSTFLWALFCGCVRAKASFLPAAFLNTESFHMAANVPVHLFRTACAVVMTWALVGILRIFDREIISRLDEYRRSLERRLSESESRYAELVEQSLVGIYIIEDGIVRYANPRMAEMLGERGAEAVVGRSFLDLVHEDDHELVREKFRLRLSGEIRSVHYTLRLKRPGGEVRSVEVHGARSDYEGKLAIIGTMLDVTDRLASEAALRESEERFSLALKGANDGIWDWRLHESHIYYSDRCREMMGFRPDEVGNDVEEWTSRIHPDDFDRVSAALAAHTSRRTDHLEVEYRLRHKDGRYRWVQARGICLFDESGNPYRIAGSLTDLTERKRLEEQLLQAQKMEAVGRLAGGVAHDFNNLLTAILGYCELLLDRLDARDPVRHDIEEINKAGERAAALTGQLLAFSRRQVMQPRVVNLNDVVRNMDKLLQRLIGEDIELETRTQAGIPNVKIDPGQIGQVLVNLAVNARDAMPDGGQLVIETSVAGPEEAVRLAEAGASMPLPAVLLSVSDTGLGMDDATRERIFEPFFTTKEKGKGTGLGLSTTYGIVHQSGGQVLVESSPGNGAIFRIYIPAVSDDSRTIAEAPEALPAKPAGGTLLVVEDEESVRKLVRETLERSGYRVLVASDGIDGLAVAEMYAGTIHLVLTDIVMPRMGGVEMADRLEEARPGIKVVLMSGYTEESVVQQGTMGRGRGYIQKPFRPDALARKIHAAIAAPSAG